MRDKAFRRARRSWRIYHENKARSIREKYPVSITFGLAGNEKHIKYTEAADQLGIDHQVYNGKVWFKTEADLNAVKICL